MICQECGHTGIIGDSYGVSCSACGCQLEGITENNICIHRYEDGVCIYCGSHESKTKYQKRKIERAIAAIEKAIELSEFFLPHDGWMKPARARKANEAWHRMRNAMQEVHLAIAKEQMDWDDDK